MTLTIDKVLNESDLLELAILKNNDDSEYLISKGEDTPNLETTLEIILRYSKDPDYHMWIAKLDDKPVGYVIGRVREGYMEVQGIYVKPEFRIRGIGKSIRTRLVEFARGIGLNEVQSYIDEGKIGALKLCESMGCVILEADKGYKTSLLLKRI